jgi:hypothetical protein
MALPAPTDGPLMITRTRPVLPRTDCEERTDNALASQAPMQFSRALFNGSGNDAGSLLLMAQCIP